VCFVAALLAAARLSADGPAPEGTEPQRARITQVSSNGVVVERPGDEKDPTTQPVLSEGPFRHGPIPPEEPPVAVTVGALVPEPTAPPPPPDPPPLPTAAEPPRLPLPPPAAPVPPADRAAVLNAVRALLPPEPEPVAATDLEPGRVALAGAGCASCQGGLLGGGGLLAPIPPAPPLAGAAGGPGCAGCGNGCPTGQCIPGRPGCCSPCEGKTCVGRFFCALYDCICCPDPCYDPHWVPLADAAFFVDAARPQTQQRLRWEADLNMMLMDRSEYIWARADGKGRGPRPPDTALAETRARNNILTMYTEGATGNIGAFAEVAYVSLGPDLAPHAANFGDTVVGTKALLFDCELLQLTFQFKTFIPSGNPLKGLGTGHTSLEPSLLLAVKLTPEMYLQGQISEWVPIGGDPAYEGAILHYHFSVNRVLCRILPDVPLISTSEANFWSFQDGAYTDPVRGSYQKSSGETYVALGQGLRLFVCNKIDFGVAADYGVSQRHWAAQQYRSEFRWRY
jgi:hypothetical protein